MREILSIFQDVEDPRSGNARRHDLHETLAIALLSMLTGGRTCVDMEDLGASGTTDRPGRPGSGPSTRTSYLAPVASPSMRAELAPPGSASCAPRSMPACAAPLHHVPLRARRRRPHPRDFRVRVAGAVVCGTMRTNDWRTVRPVEIPRPARPAARRWRSTSKGIIKNAHQN